MKRVYTAKSGKLDALSYELCFISCHSFLIIVLQMASYFSGVSPHRPQQPQPVGQKQAALPVLLSVLLLLQPANAFPEGLSSAVIFQTKVIQRHSSPPPFVPPGDALRKSAAGRTAPGTPHIPPGLPDGNSSRLPQCRRRTGRTAIQRQSVPLSFHLQCVQCSFFSLLFDFFKLLNQKC